MNTTGRNDRACAVMRFEPFGCLTCPLPACVHDIGYERYRRHRAALRSTAIARAWAAGATVGEIAVRVGVSKRMVYRLTATARGRAS